MDLDEHRSCSHGATRRTSLCCSQSPRFRDLRHYLLNNESFELGSQALHLDEYWPHRRLPGLRGPEFSRCSCSVWGEKASEQAQKRTHPCLLRQASQVSVNKHNLKRLHDGTPKAWQHPGRQEDGSGSEVRVTIVQWLAAVVRWARPLQPHFPMVGRRSERSRLCLRGRSPSLGRLEEQTPHTRPALPMEPFEGDAAAPTLTGAPMPPCRTRLHLSAAVGETYTITLREIY